MLPNLNRAASGVSMTTRVFLRLASAAALAAPLICLGRTTAFADDSSNPVAETDITAPQTVKIEEFLPPLSKSEETIIAALDKPTNMCFTDTPLQDAVDYFKYLHSIEIQLDTRPLQEAGISSDAPVAGNMKGISLRTALRLLLAEYELTFVIRDEVLQITTRERASTLLVTRTYPVGDLVGDSAEQQGYCSIVGAITTNIGPTTWSEVGGPGSVSIVKNARSLVISQTRDIHDEILQLLQSLRTAQRAPNPTGNSK